MAGDYLNAGTVRIVLGGLIDTQIERERRGERSASCSRLRRPGWTCPWSGRGLPEGTKVRRSAAVALGSGAGEGAIPAGTEDLTWTLATRG